MARHSCLENVSRHSFHRVSTRGNARPPCARISEQMVIADWLTASLQVTMAQAWGDQTFPVPFRPEATWVNITGVSVYHAGNNGFSQILVIGERGARAWGNQGGVRGGTREACVGEPGIRVRGCVHGELRCACVGTERAWICACCEV